MRRSLIVMTVGVLASLTLAVTASATNVTFAVGINDATELISAYAPPPWTGAVYVSQETFDVAGQVNSSMYYADHQYVTPVTYYYNIFEPDDPGILSDTLAMGMDPAGYLYFDFRSDDLSETGLPSYYLYPPGPTTFTALQVGMTSLPLANGDVFTVSWVSPEPSTFILLGIGAVSLVAYARRRRAS